MSLRVLVVDDSVVFRRMLTQTLSSLPEVEVVGSVSNGKLALQPTTGFLTGAAGVALALSAAVTEGATPWDRVLSLP